MKNELNADDLDSEYKGEHKDLNGISSIEELWDELLDDDKAKEDRLISKLDFTPNNEEEMQNMISRIKDKIDGNQD